MSVGERGPTEYTSMPCLYKTDEVAQAGVKYIDIFSEDIHKQKEVTSIFETLFEIRQRLNAEETAKAKQAVPEWSWSWIIIYILVLFIHLLGNK